MKRISIISLFSLVLSACMLTTSCEDMLTPDMDRYAEENQYAKDSVYSVLGILRSVQNVAERTIILDASRSDLVVGGTYTTDSISDLLNFNSPEDGSSALCNVADYYHIVNSCNFYLANVDTTITQNNESVMVKEWAQVQALRAWAYIQLVRNYGEVPFVTSPVSSTDDAERESANAPKVNAQNLATLLVENGLERAYGYQSQRGMPNYGTITGNLFSYSSQLNLIPVELMLADAYLMANDYLNAANYYFRYFDLNCAETPRFNNDSYMAGVQENPSSSGTTSEYLITSGNLCDIFNATEPDDAIFTSTSASSPSEGNVLTQVLSVYGFNTTVSNAGVTATYDEQYQQLLPSTQYLTLNRAQHANRYTQEGEVAIMDQVLYGDGRRYAYAPEMNMRSIGREVQLITKYVQFTNNRISEMSMGFGATTSYNKAYQTQLYRLPLALLRYAEAVNRLGFPELAFGILKDGIITENLPTYGTIDIVRNAQRTVRILDEAGEQIRIDTIQGVQVGKLDLSNNSAAVSYTVDSTIAVCEGRYVGDFIPQTHHDSIPGVTLEDISEDIQATWQDVEYVLEPTAFSGGMYYMSAEEAKGLTQYPCFNFGSKWSVTDATDSYLNIGLHARGCNHVAGRYDTVYTYARQVAEKLAEEYARTNSLTYAQQQEYAKTLYANDTLCVVSKGITKEMIQNAVENIIVDELALETAFEGNRFGDLIRIAGHKDQAGFNGTEWLAWKIGRRSQNYTDDASQVNATLRDKLLNKSNWYLPLPE